MYKFSHRFRDSKQSFIAQSMNTEEHNIYAEDDNNHRYPGKVLNRKENRPECKQRKSSQRRNLEAQGRDKCVCVVAMAGTREVKKRAAVYILYKTGRVN